MARPCAIAVAVMAWLAPAAPAHAQWEITTRLGMNVSGDVEHGKGGLGGSVGYRGRRLGFEIDLQRYQHFFKDAEVFPLDPTAPPNCVASSDPSRRCTDIDTDALSVLANVVVPILPGATRWRPYATAGLGLVRAWTNEEGRHQNDLGFNGGGGLTFDFRQRVGLRADLRHVRALVDDEHREGVRLRDYGFWRFSLGVVFRLSR